MKKAVRILVVALFVLGAAPALASSVPPWQLMFFGSGSFAAKAGSTVTVSLGVNDFHYKGSVTLKGSDDCLRTGFSCSFSPSSFNLVGNAVWNGSTMTIKTPTGVPNNSSYKFTVVASSAAGSESTTIFGRVCTTAAAGLLCR